MALRKMSMICAGGDKTLAEWDTETAGSERMAEIEAEFKKRLEEGYFAADVTDKNDKLIDKFNSNADILLIPHVKGGQF